MFFTFSIHLHHQTCSHFKQTLPNKHEIDTLCKGYGGSYDNDTIVLIGATDPSL